MLRCTSTISNITTLMGCMPTTLTCRATSREPSLNTGTFCTTRGTIIKNFLIKLWTHPCLNSFSQELKILSRPDGFMLYDQLGLDFFSTSELLNLILKIRLLIRARPNFYRNSDNPNVSLGNVDCSLYTRPIALKDDYR